jgi:hypothetical protein
MHIPVNTIHNIIIINIGGRVATRFVFARHTLGALVTQPQVRKFETARVVEAEDSTSSKDLRQVKFFLIANIFVTACI